MPRLRGIDLPELLSVQGSGMRGAGVKPSARASNAKPHADAAVHPRIRAPAAAQPKAPPRAHAGEPRRPQQQHVSEHGRRVVAPIVARGQGFGGGVSVMNVQFPRERESRRRGRARVGSTRWSRSLPWRWGADERRRATRCGVSKRRERRKARRAETTGVRAATAARRDRPRERRREPRRRRRRRATATAARRGARSDHARSGRGEETRERDAREGRACRWRSRASASRATRTR